jgi:hypothetical protein
MLPDRFATERAELRKVQAGVISIDRGSRLAWLAHDKHYMLPGGYGLTAAQRLQYLQVPPYRIVSTDEVSAVVKECAIV